MGQIRHGSAATTHAVRAAIQRSQASIAELSRDLGINPKLAVIMHRVPSVMCGCPLRVMCGCPLRVKARRRLSGNGPGFAGDPGQAADCPAVPVSNPLK